MTNDCGCEDDSSNESEPRLLRARVACGRVATMVSAESTVDLMDAVFAVSAVLFLAAE